MDWRKFLLSPNGRIGRKSYWIWIVVMYAAAIVAGVVDMVIFGRDVELAPFSTLYSLAVLYPGVCVTTKRLHDTNRSGWWVLMPWATTLIVVIAVIPLMSKGEEVSAVNVIATLIAAVALLAAFITLIVWIGFLKGTPGPNKYGEPNSGDREVTPTVEVFS